MTVESLSRSCHAPRFVPDLGGRADKEFAVPGKPLTRGTMLFLSKCPGGADDAPGPAQENEPPMQDQPTSSRFLSSRTAVRRSSRASRAARLGVTDAESQRARSEGIAYALAVALEWEAPEGGEERWLAI